MPRKAIAVQDDGGFYRITGRVAVPWVTFERDLEEQYAREEVASVAVQPLRGWAMWRWGLLVNGDCVGFLDGDDPPAVVLDRAVERQSPI